MAPSHPLPFTWRRVCRSGRRAGARLGKERELVRRVKAERLMRGRWGHRDFIDLEFLVKERFQK